MNYVLITARVEKEIFNQYSNSIFYENSLVGVRTGGNRNNPVEIFINVDFQQIKQQGSSISQSHRLNFYDREIHDAVVTLYEASNTFISVRMILNALAGGNINRITEITGKHILGSVEKMRDTQIDIDCSDEANAFKSEDFQYSGMLLPCRFVGKVPLNNNIARQCIEILAPPPLLGYAKLRRQFSSINSELLNVLTVRREHLMLKLYLLRELVWMKNPHSKRNNSISLETIYKYLDLKITANKDDERHQRKTIRDNIKKCLEFWIAKKFIKGYDSEKNERQFSKVVIEV